MLWALLQVVEIQLRKKTQHKKWFSLKNLNTNHNNFMRHLWRIQFKV